MRALPVSALVLSMALVAGCDGVSSWCQQLVIGETVFTGTDGWFQAEPLYTRVVSTFDRGFDGVDVPTVVRIGSQTILVATATPDTLRAAGVPEVTGGGGAFRMFGSRRTATGDGIGIEFFKGTGPRSVGMNCGPGSACDFAIGWGERPLVSLPATGSQLDGKLPTIGVLRECVSAY